jgi:hypothetical protein
MMANVAMTTENATHFAFIARYTEGINKRSEECVQMMSV